MKNEKRKQMTKQFSLLGKIGGVTIQLNLWFILMIRPSFCYFISYGNVHLYRKMNPLMKAFRQPSHQKGSYLLDLYEMQNGKRQTTNNDMQMTGKSHYTRCIFGENKQHVFTITPFSWHRYGFYHSNQKQCIWLQSSILNFNYYYSCTAHLNTNSMPLR